MEDCGWDHHRALHRIHQIREEETLEHLEPEEGLARARACLSRLDERAERAANAGLADAKDAIGRGHLCQLTLGYRSEDWATCASCMRLERLVGPSCTRCGAVPIRRCSVACCFGDEEAAYANAFNAAIEDHIRATVNPRFRWECVRSAPSS